MRPAPSCRCSRPGWRREVSTPGGSSRFPPWWHEPAVTSSLPGTATAKRSKFNNAAGGDSIWSILSKAAPAWPRPPADQTSAHDSRARRSPCAAKWTTSCAGRTNSAGSTPTWKQPGRPWEARASRSPWLNGGTVNEIDAVTQALPATAARHRAQDPHVLTATETKVEALAIEGLTNREIADQLYIGTETVKTHLSRVYDDGAFGVVENCGPVPWHGPTRPKTPGSRPVPTVIN